MRQIKTLLVSVLLSFIGFQTHATNYYVDATKGADQNDGLSTAVAWQTISKVNSVTFQPGDIISFKSGETFTGQFITDGDGTFEQPITVNAYGSGVKPMFVGEDQYLETIIIDNNFWHLDGLDISNDHTPTIGRTGVLVSANNRKTKHTALRNLTIHDCEGLNDAEQSSGFAISYKYQGSGVIDGLLIENNEITSGMMQGVHGDRGDGWAMRTEQLVVRNNYIHDIGGHGIFINNSIGALVEHNTVQNVGVGSLVSAEPAWVFSSDDTVFQHNILSGGKTNLANDGQGMLTGYITHNTLWQYNYVSDNGGGCIGNLANGNWNGVNENTIYRYNICINNGYEKDSSIHIAGSMTNVQIYNNTIYVNLDADHTFVNPYKWGGIHPDGGEFYNNIFYVVNNGFTATASTGTATNFVFDNNSWTGNFTNNLDLSTSFTGDPGLKNPGSYEEEDYKLQSNSDLIDMGVVISGAPTVDYFGFAVPSYGMPDIGAYEINAADEDNVTPPEDDTTPPEDDITPPEDDTTPPEDDNIDSNNSSSGGGVFNLLMLALLLGVKVRRIKIIPAQF